MINIRESAFLLGRRAQARGTDIFRMGATHFQNAIKSLTMIALIPRVASSLSLFFFIGCGSSEVSDPAEISPTPETTPMVTPTNIPDISTPTPEASPTPTPMPETTPLPIPMISEPVISSGEIHRVILNAYGNVFSMSWAEYLMGVPEGAGVNSPLIGIYNPVKANIGDVVAISAGDSHTLALKKDGTVWGWGSNSTAQTGVYSCEEYMESAGNQPPTYSPRQVVNLQNIIAIQGGDLFSLALGSDGTVWGWGEASRLGVQAEICTDANRNEVVIFPTPINGLSNIKSICAGSSDSMAVNSNGELFAWGYNSWKLSGEDIEEGIKKLSLPEGEVIRDCSVGGGFYLARATDGNIYAWGENKEGSFGQATPTESNTPTYVGNIFGKFDAGNDYSLWIDSDGSAWGSGKNSYGQLATGNYESQWTPVKIAGLVGVSQVSAGNGRSSFLLDEGDVYIAGEIDGGGHSYESKHPDTYQVLSPDGSKPFNVYDAWN